MPRPNDALKEQKQAPSHPPPKGEEFTLRGEIPANAKQPRASALGLTSIVIGNSVTRIGDEAFSRCTALKTINAPAKKANYYKQRLPKNLHGLIVELPAVKNAKK